MAGDDEPGDHWRRRCVHRGEAKSLALAGCAVAVLGLFVGWIVLGEGWFEFWRSDALREPAGGGAFRYGGFIALIALMVGSRND
jgi:predicted small integral membrane protein